MQRILQRTGGDEPGAVVLEEELGRSLLRLGDEVHAFGAGEGPGVAFSRQGFLGIRSPE